MTTSRSQEFIIGGLSAMSASTITHPIDLIKVRMLLHGEQKANQVAKLSIVKTIIINEGPLSLYKGLSATLLRQSLYSTTRFGFYDMIKKILGETPNRRLPYRKKILATMSGGAIGAVIACPADTMLVRMQANGRLPVNQRKPYRNVFQAINYTIRTEGFRTLYRGLPPLLSRGIAVTTAQFSTYDQTKEMLESQLPQSMGNNFRTHMISAFTAGICAALVSCPLDVIKSRMMNTTIYKSTTDCLKKTIQTEGLRGLYKGFIPCYMRMAPQVILMWTLVEQYRKMFQYLQNSGNPN